MKNLFIVTTKTNNGSITKQKNANISKRVNGLNIEKGIKEILYKKKVKFDQIDKDLQYLINYMLEKLKLEKGEYYTYNIEHHVNNYENFTIHKNTNGIEGVKASFIYYYDIESGARTSLNFYPTKKGKLWGTEANKSQPLHVPVKSGTMVAFTSEYHKPIVEETRKITRKLVSIFAVPKKN